MTFLRYFLGGISTGLFLSSPKATFVKYFIRNPRWQIQRGVGVIPKSVFPNELTDNLGVWGWTLDQGEMEVGMIVIFVTIQCHHQLHRFITIPMNCHCHCQVLNKMETGVRKIVPLITLPGGQQKIRDIEDINFPFGFKEVDACE